MFSAVKLCMRTHKARILCMYRVKGHLLRINRYNNQFSEFGLENKYNARTSSMALQYKENFFSLVYVSGMT